MQVIITEQGALLVRPGPLELRMHLRLLPGTVPVRVQITIEGMGACMRPRPEGQSSKARLQKPDFIPHLKFGSVWRLLHPYLQCDATRFGDPGGIPAHHYLAAYYRSLAAVLRAQFTAKRVPGGDAGACACPVANGDSTLASFCLAACSLLPLLRIC